ncbi:MAG: glycerol-3-phosphate 1-O-acyltransferase PlsY [Pseudanabaenaceae cyanobacterium SKYGB_i_bin29]|nr:glycerol-3-phosphate 1-O-acyltransferase PlsY [Pseudanabaenaceae cyanobacterium SKYG29]MDW8421272.1 glycerol-3-phosphate 1-O-acyltransferase PlsY [Pseudanabaenaceae cyanobacterium SKYGB_i_bin29]
MEYTSGLICLVVAYLLGSIPTGYLVGKVKGIDIREHGSGSTGATNVWRVIGKKEGVFVWLVDSLKGYGAVWLALHWGQLFPNYPLHSWWVVGSALMVVLGHSRSVWLGFQGGKSVASGLGVLFALNPKVALVAFGVWGVSLLIWRTVSISSILAAFATPVLFYFLDGRLPYLLLTTVAGLFVIWRHSSNIQRILAGTEPQIWGKVSTGTGE